MKSLGILELLTAAGLLPPAALDTALVPVTAVCWTLLMADATIAHGRRGESAPVALTLVHLALAPLTGRGGHS